MWRELIGSLYTDAQLNKACSRAQVEHAERKLKVTLPEELRSLLLETDGFTADYGASIVWSARSVSTILRHPRAAFSEPRLVSGGS